MREFECDSSSGVADNASSWSTVASDAWLASITMPSRFISRTQSRPSGDRPFHVGLSVDESANWLFLLWTTESPTLGALLRSLRSRQGWPLKEMSVKSGIPVSTLSKVEHGQLTLTYDKLYQLSQKLGMRMSELFAEEPEAEPPVTALRSLGDLQSAVRVETPNYDYHYLCAELRRKLMIPVITRPRAKTLDEFGSLVHH